MGGHYCKAMAAVRLHNDRCDAAMMDGHHMVTTLCFLFTFKLHKREFGLGIYILKLEHCLKDLITNFTCARWNT